MKVAVLGPGGVGGLVAGVLAQTGVDVLVLAREPTVEAIAEHGLTVRSITFGDIRARVRVCARMREPVDVLIVATKAAGLGEALGRIEAEPALVLPLLNGLDHLTVLRERFDPDTVLAGTIRVESDRPEPGVVVHTSQFLRVDMATRAPTALAGMQALGRVLEEAGIPTKLTLPVSARSEAQVMWSKLVRLNALACTTSAYDIQLGQIRRTPELRADLVGAIEEACAVGRAEGADDVDPRVALRELELAHDSLGSSMQRDIAAGRPPELDAIPGSILRAAARHDLSCPTIERLVLAIAARAGVPAPLIVAGAPAPVPDGSSPLERALVIRRAVVERGIDVYHAPNEHPELVYGRAELEALLRHQLADAVFSARAAKTRAKEAKQAVCGALGYPVPPVLKRVKPRLPGQDLEVFTQKRDNVQVYNEPPDPSRRYAFIGLDDPGRVLAVRVLEGAELLHLDTTGTRTSKYQARRKRTGATSKLVSPADTPAFVAELAPADHLDASVLASLRPVSRPVPGTVLTVRGLYERLQELTGRELEYSSSERRRGELLHRLVCKTLGLGDYADTGRFPDIVCQALEVKLQTAATIDLGLVLPDGREPALSLSPRLRHCDARYLVAYAMREGEQLRIEHIVVSTGETFFEEFRRVGGGSRNDKFQLHLPRDFFEPEQLGDGSVQCRLDLGEGC